jgi:hypothetical protein
MSGFRTNICQLILGRDINQNFVLRLKFSSENRHLRKAAKRYSQLRQRRTKIQFVLLRKKILVFWQLRISGLIDRICIRTIEAKFAFWRVSCVYLKIDANSVPVKKLPNLLAS